MRVRFDNMESIFMRPPEAEVESIFEKRLAAPYRRRECEGDVCSFKPFKSAEKQPEIVRGAPEALLEEEEDDDLSPPTPPASSLSNEELAEIADRELTAMLDTKRVNKK